MNFDNDSLEPSYTMFKFYNIVCGKSFNYIADYKNSSEYIQYLEDIDNN